MGIDLVREAVSDEAPEAWMNDHLGALAGDQAREARDLLETITDESVRSKAAWRSISDGASSLDSAANLIMADDLPKAEAEADSAEEWIEGAVPGLSGCLIESVGAKGT